MVRNQYSRMINEKTDQQRGKEKRATHIDDLYCPVIPDLIRDPVCFVNLDIAKCDINLRSQIVTSSLPREY